MFGINFMVSKYLNVNSFIYLPNSSLYTDIHNTVIPVLCDLPSQSLSWQWIDQCRPSPFSTHETRDGTYIPVFHLYNVYSYIIHTHSSVLIFPSLFSSPSSCNLRHIVINSSFVCWNFSVPTFQPLKSHIFY